MYLRQVRQMGVLGLVGYLLFGAGYLLMFATEVISAYILPGLVHLAPGYVNDLVVAAAGGKPAGDIGAMSTVLNVTGIGYMVGGLLFGVALFRANILSRLASALLAVGTIATVSLAVLPESFNRPLAVPVGLALVGLGVSLWRDQRSQVVETASTITLVEHATV